MTAAEEERDEARRLHAEADLDAKVNRDTANRAEARLAKVREECERPGFVSTSTLRTRIREALDGDL